MSYLKSRPRWLVAMALLLAAAVTAGAATLQTKEKPRSPQDVAATNQAKSMSHVFHLAAEEVGPAVVKIRSHTNAKRVSGLTHHQKSQNSSSEENPFKGTPFEDMLPNFKNFGGDEMLRGTPERDGLGSGVIIDKSGIVLTNNHVVKGADELVVTLSDGREFKATDVKTDPQTDLAVVRIHADGDLPVAKLGNSDELEVGDWVIAIGAPFGLDHTVSAGIISSKARELSDLNRGQMLQTDAAINPGNSGGPLANLDGEVVGINTAIATSSGGYQGIGFSIPINAAKWVTKQLIDTGHVARGYLGVQLEEINSELASKLGVHQDEGVLVADVMPNTPAAAAGVKEGDVITGFEGKAVHGPRDLRDLVERAKIGSKQTLDLNRDGKHMSVDVTLKALPDNLAENIQAPGKKQEHSSDDATYSSEDLGFEVGAMTADEADTYKDFSGVVIRQVEDGSPAAHAGLQAGYLIRQVGKTPVKNVEQFAEAMKHESAKSGVMFLIRTPAGNRYVVLQKA